MKLSLSPRTAGHVGVGLVILAVAIVFTILVISQAWLVQLIMGVFGLHVSLTWVVVITAAAWAVMVGWWYLAAYRA